MTTPRVTVPVDVLRELIDASSEVRDLLAKVPEMQDRKYVGTGNRFINAIGAAQRSYTSAAPAPEGGAVDDRLHGAISMLKSWVELIQLRKRGEAVAGNPIVDCVNDLPAIIRQLEAAELEIEGAFEAYEDAALATREEAPAEAGEIGAEYDAAAHCVTLAECPPGLFFWNGTLGFKSEYGAMEPDEATNGKHWKVGNQADAYCADSGEYFWGGTSNHDDRAKLLVYPIDAATVAMVASHGPSALRAHPQAREDAQPVATLRPVVLAFAHLMEAKLKENDWKRGWKKDSTPALLGRLREEVDELEQAIAPGSRTDVGSWRGLVANEAADVANFAMMVADVCGGLPDSAVRSISESTTHPAPDALRVAVEALDEMADTDPDEGTSWFHDRANKARADIAALQAEQGAK